jgi:hypothetical protein
MRGAGAVAARLELTTRSGQPLSCSGRKTARPTAAHAEARADRRTPPPPTGRRPTASSAGGRLWCGRRCMGPAPGLRRGRLPGTGPGGLLPIAKGPLAAIPASAPRPGSGLAIHPGRCRQCRPSSRCMALLPRCRQQRVHRHPRPDRHGPALTPAPGRLRRGMLRRGRLRPPAPGRCPRCAHPHIAWDRTRDFANRHPGPQRHGRALPRASAKACFAGAGSGRPAHASAAVASILTLHGIGTMFSRIAIPAHDAMTPARGRRGGMLRRGRLRPTAPRQCCRCVHPHVAWDRNRVFANCHPGPRRHGRALPRASAKACFAETGSGRLPRASAAVASILTLHGIGTSFSRIAVPARDAMTVP